MGFFDNLLEKAQLGLMMMAMESDMVKELLKDLAQKVMSHPPELREQAIAQMAAAVTPAWEQFADEQGIVGEEREQIEELLSKWSRTLLYTGEADLRPIVVKLGPKTMTLMQRVLDALQVARAEGRFTPLKAEVA